MRRPAVIALTALLSGPALAQSATVTVQVTGVADGQGAVSVGLCPTALEEKACTLGQSRAAQGAAMRFAFRNVPPGAYAVAVYQDVNGNGRLDRNALGLPTEPYGFSNDVGRIGPPTFSGARVPVPASGATIPVRLARFGQ